MSRRRQLKGVAAGIASSFLSRNNDIDGYWGLGVLYKKVAALGESTFHLDILTGASSPPFEHAGKVAEGYRAFLRKQTEKLGLHECQITQSTIDITFDIPVSKNALFTSEPVEKPSMSRSPSPMILAGHGCTAMEAGAKNTIRTGSKEVHADMPHNKSTETRLSIVAIRTG